MQKLNKKLEFDSNYSEKNFLVALTKKWPDSTAKSYFKNNFTIDKKNFDESLLSYN